MRTTTSTPGTTGKTRGASVTTTLAALALALPMSGFFGGTAFASATSAPAASSDHGKATAPGQAKKDDSSTAAASTSSSTRTSSSDHSQGNASTTGAYNQPQPYSNADKNNTGANDTSASNPYKSTRDGSPSMNGNGGGASTGKPCAGCVGKADNKNPKGQAPGGSDHNNGYECDGNNGIGKGNPAHTGCTTTTPPPPPVCVPSAANHNCGTDTPPPPPCVKTAANHNCGTDTPPPPSCVKTAANHDCGTDVPDCTGVMGGTATPAECGQTNGGNKNDKLTICHATGSASNPFVVITPNKNGVVHGHIGHQDGRDIIPPFSYNDHGVTKSFPGQNWTAANQASFANGCKAPATPVLCPAGSTMVNGICTTPATPVTPIVCASGQTMVNGTCQSPAVTPVPPTCPNGAMVGPIVPGTARPGCPIEGENGGGAQVPGTVVPPVTVQPVSVPVQQPVPTVIGQGTAPQPVMGIVGAPATTPAVISARPTALPFTGSNATLLAEGAALMLLLGGGLLVATRKKTGLAG